MIKVNRTLLPGAVPLVILGIVTGLAGALSLVPSDEKLKEPVGIILGEHQCAVRCMAFAPDSKTLATGDGFQNVPGEIKLWDLVTRTERATLHGEQKGIHALAFAPDGRTLATADLDQIVKLWDVATGRLLTSVAGSLPRSVRVELSPDGQTLAVTGWDGDTGSVRLWRVDRDASHSLASGSGPFAFTGDSRRLALWRLGAGAQATSAGRTDGPDLAPAARFSDLAAVQFWDIPLEQERLRLRGDQNFVWAIAFSPDGRTLASGGFDESVKIWDVATGRQQTTLCGHKDQVDAVAFASDGRLLVSASHDGTVRLWDPAAGRELATLCRHAGRVTCVASSPDGQWVASGGHDRTVRLWQLTGVQ